MRRALLGATGAVALGAFGVVLAGFIWPEGGLRSELNLGPADAFTPGSGAVLTDLVDFTDTRWDVPVLMAGSPGFTRNPQAVRIGLARHEDGEFSAFLARDPRNGCPLDWRTDLPSLGPGGYFRDRCHSSTYDASGVRVFGPTPKDMDYFDVRVDEEGDVIVDLRTLHEGERMPPAVDYGTPYPTATPVGAFP